MVIVIVMAGDGDGDLVYLKEVMKVVRRLVGWMCCRYNGGFKNEYLSRVATEAINSPVEMMLIMSAQHGRVQLHSLLLKFDHSSPSRQHLCPTGLH